MQLHFGTRGHGGVTVTLLSPDDGFLTQDPGLPEPLLGDVARQEGRDVALRLGEDRTFVSTGEVTWNADRGLSAYERAQHDLMRAWWVEALAWCEARGLTLDDDEPDHTDMGDLWRLVPVTLSAES